MNAISRPIRSSYTSNSSKKLVLQQVYGSSKSYSFEKHWPYDISFRIMQCLMKLG